MQSLVAAVALAAVASAQGPCDILIAAGNPCVAAHSTTRALFAAYDGPLYNVTRASDNKSANIGVLAPGGFADAAAHDAFCAALDCVISNVFDQTTRGNHLRQRHKLVNASQLRVFVGGGVPVYGMQIDAGFGYHVDQTSGIALGNDPESIYAVMSGTHYNGGASRRNASAACARANALAAYLFAFSRASVLLRLRQLRDGRHVGRRGRDGGHLLRQRALAGQLRRRGRPVGRRGPRGGHVRTRARGRLRSLLSLLRSRLTLTPLLLAPGITAAGT